MNKEAFSVGGGKGIPLFTKPIQVFHVWRHNMIVAAVSALLKITIKRGETDAVIYSDSGVSLVIGGGLSSGTSTSTSGELQTYRVKEKIGDVLICRTWNGTAEGTTDVPVAANFNSRQLASETMGGLTYDFIYAASLDDFNDYRTSDNGTTEQTQIVIPLWYENCLINVSAIDYSGVTFDDTINPPRDLKLIEVSARCWAKAEI